MKGHILGFLLAAIYCPFAFADGVSVSRVLPSGNAQSANTNEIEKSSGVTARTARIPESGVGARINAAATRNASPTNAASSTIVRSGARTVNLSDDDPTSSSARTSGNTVARSHAGGAVSSSAQSNLAETVKTVGRNARVNAASMNANPMVRRVGISLRPTTAEVGGRAVIADSGGIQTGSNIGSEARTLQSRAANKMTRESIADAKDRMEQMADLNKSCQEQYNDCMDQFCAVVDSNQKRCSCSANLSRYSKVEAAVKDANTQLNDVAQRIRYVGLSADEISAIMKETEAEEALSGKTDTSETRNMLTQIEKMIKDPKSNSSYSADTSFGLDMDLDFSGDTADLFSLDFLNTGTTSFSNLRGTELYNAAKKRCNTVLNQCKNAGGTPQQITGNYDLAIDKDCIAYEQGLKKMNETLVGNVRSANLMLQKARLAVLQNKNQYDAKGCIGALETCMTDDMVCGSDYAKCLDPTKRYIDENGEVVLGENITDILKFTKSYNNSVIDMPFISNAYLNQKLTDTECTKTASSGQIGGDDGSCNVKYLMQKIGTGAKATDNGLCRPVLDKCQYYTYDSQGKYKPYNDVVVNYIQRALVNIRAGQSKIIADYAATCMTDIAACYNKQVTQVNSWSNNASVNSIYNVMTGACYNVALTCAYAVFQHSSDSAAGGSSTPINIPEINCSSQTESTAKNQCYIKAISELFYQSLLCPDHSEFKMTGNPSSPDTNGTSGGWVNVKCKCETNYEVWGGACVVPCGAFQERNSYGTCVCVDGAQTSGAACTCKDGYTGNTAKTECTKS